MSYWSFSLNMKTSRLIIFLALIFTNFGCANTPQLKSIESRAFLNEYALSKEGSEDHALVSLWKKDVAWTSYKKVILAPIEVKVNQDSRLNRVAHAEKAQLMEMLEFRVRESFKPMFKLVNTPGTDTLRLELVVTDTELADVLKQEFQSVHPSADSVAGLNHLLSREEAFAGKSSIRGKIIDSTTGDLLMVVADQIDDDALLDDFMIVWGNAGKHYKYWSRQLGYQLCRFQKHNYCQQP